MIRKRRVIASCAALLAALPVCVSQAAPRADDPPPEGTDSGVFLTSIQGSEGLQAFLDGAVEDLLAGDPALRTQALRVALIDLPAGSAVGSAPDLAHWNGDSPVYPASVVKFVYLMAAYAWRDRGLLEIDPALDRQLRDMTYASSNRASQHVLRRLTETEAGPRLGPEEYASFRERRLRVKRWLQELGIGDLHTVHPN